MSEELRGRRVLVVDDDEDLRTLFRMALELSGADVRDASSAAVALEVLEAFAPHAAVLDRGMPDVDGLTLLARIRVRPATSTLPAVMLSGYARDVDRDEALAAGFDAWLPKPVAPSDLVSTLVEVIARAPRASA